jgi:hypothetical protein
VRQAAEGVGITKSSCRAVSQNPWFRWGCAIRTAAEYRAEASRLRLLADTMTAVEIRQGIVNIAAQYEQLAHHAERLEREGKL